MFSTFSIWLGVTFPEMPPAIALDCPAVLITVDGVLAAVKPEEPGAKTFTLKELQGYVGGYIEVVSFKHGLLVVDEEGKLKHAPINRAATHFLKSLLRRGDFLVGNVLIVKKDAVA